MPSNHSYRCKYLENWVLIKEKWELPMVQADAVAKGEKVTLLILVCLGKFLYDEAISLEFNWHKKG